MDSIAQQMKESVSAMMSGATPENTEQGVQDAGVTDTASAVPNGDDSDSGSDNGGYQQDVNSEGNDSQHSELSEREQAEIEKAMQSGWKSQEDFHGHPDDFIKPREWNRTAALYKRIDREASERRRLEKEVSSFSDRVKNVMEVAKANAIAELEAKKREAVESADYSEVQRLDNEIKQTNDDYEIETPEPPPPQIRHEVEDWMRENPWFEQDKEMTEFAMDFQHTQLLKLSDPANPTGEELSRALKRTTRAIKAAFPDKFQRKPRHQAPSLERGNPRQSNRKLTYNDLTAEEKKVLENIERLPGGMSREDYIQAVQDMRGNK